MTIDDSVKLQRLYELYEQPMYRIAFAVLKNSAYAEDAVSDAFERIVRKISRIGSPESSETRSYIIKVIKNTAIDQYRRNTVFYRRNRPIDEETERIPDSSVNVENVIIQDSMASLTEKLSDSDRKIIELRFNEQMPWREVAEHLSLTETTVRKRFERARKKLKGELSNERK
ncbi:MAG: sigma-70 family RNA polymerase sigma factor [Ruminococcus sp.]|nr:sigma-70 family RNA polymerase sigma factor [Ruminococcus sp.]MDE6784581.1 sigma-70 family RNA polymerase sigma factor [Ruminococcus sp.]